MTIKNCKCTKCLAEEKQVSETSWFSSDAEEQLYTDSVEVPSCARCGEHHPSLKIEKFDNHDYFNAFGMCPIKNQPVLLALNVGQTQSNIIQECNELMSMLLEKNRKYGNSALNPVRVFSKASKVEQILVRLDDKLSRLKNVQIDEDEDVVKDLLGYLILLKIAINEVSDPNQDNN